MRVLIDADGFPVTDIAIRLCNEFQVSCVLLCDTAHVFQRTGAEILVFDKGADGKYDLLCPLIPDNEKNSDNALPAPGVAVEGTVADGLGDMLWLYGLATCKVGDGACNLYYPVVGAGRELQMCHRPLQKCRAVSTQGCKPTKHRAIHHGVAVYAYALEAGALYLACSDDTTAYIGTRLRGRAVVNLGDAHRRNLDVYIYSIHQWARDMCHVSVYCCCGACTLLCRVVVVATWTWIHRGYKGKVGGILHGVLSSRDSYMSILERLA